MGALSLSADGGHDDPEAIRPAGPGPQERQRLRALMAST
jgi:hypothetical protein